MLYKLQECRIYVLLAQNGKGFPILHLVWQQLQLKEDIRVGFYLTDHPPYLLCLAKITFWSPRAKPLAGAERQKERSPKERTAKLVGTGRNYWGKLAGTKRGS